MIWLASYPRSGNTLFRLVLHQIYERPTYSLYTDDALAGGIDRLVGHRHYVKGIADDNVFVKTHEHPFGDGHKAIYIVRDGRDAIVSYAFFKQANGHEHASLERVIFQIIHSNVWGGWSANVMAWTTRPGTRVIKYEDLVERPIEIVSECLDWLGINWIERACDIPTFGELNERYPRFFRSGTVGGYRKHMSKFIEQEFWRKHHIAMVAMNYG